MSTDGPIQVSVNAFKIDDPAFFGQVPDFIKLKIRANSAGNQSMEYYALTVFRDLAAYHFDDKDPQALIDEELQRFSWLERMASLENRDSLYLAALKQFEKAYLIHPGQPIFPMPLPKFYFQLVSNTSRRNLTSTNGT